MAFRKFKLRELFWLAFCAAFIVAVRSGVRLNLKIPGHAMLFTGFFLILARGCVPRHGAASLVGLIAGLASSLVGGGAKGLEGILRFLLPALAVDAAGAVAPRFPARVLPSALVGAAAGATRFLTLVGADWFAGMDRSTIVVHAATVSFSHALFGAAGGALAAGLVRKLEARGLLAQWQGEA
jgi:hypothetical protein